MMLVVLVGGGGGVRLDSIFQTGLYSEFGSMLNTNYIAWAVLPGIQ